jgi:cobalt-zinc-cadmium efflux system outer membrane protein
MTKRLWCFAGGLAAALALAAPVLAQQHLPPNGTIRQGFDAAWARQPEQRAAALRREVGAATARAAQRWFPEPPSLELNAKTDRFTRNHGGREYEAVVAVPLWLPGERSRLLATTAAESGALDAKLATARWRLAGEVREAFWAYHRARLDRELADRRLANAQLIARDVIRRVKAGDLARSDGHQAEATVAAADSALAEAAVALSQAKQRWMSLTGIASSPSTEAAPEARPPEAPNHLVHPAVHELTAVVELARRQRELAHAQQVANPEVTLGTARERGEFGERYSQAVIVGMRVPLGTHGTSQAKKAAAYADLLEAETQLTLANERTQSEVAAAADRVKTLQVALEAAERRALLARESRGFFDKSFRLGETDLPTRLRVELEAFEADRQAARSRIELAAAISSWRQAAGLLPE